MIRIKRAYESPAPEDGARYLVDRLWPRGLSKERIKLAEWLKELAPSAELRKWFAHRPDRWSEFEVRYREELASKEDAIIPLVEAARTGTVTLVYAARDEAHNDAVVLKDVLEAHMNVRR